MPRGLARISHELLDLITKYLFLFHNISVIAKQSVFRIKSKKFTLRATDFSAAALLPCTRRFTAVVDYYDFIHGASICGKLC